MFLVVIDHALHQVELNLSWISI